MTSLSGTPAERDGRGWDEIEAAARAQVSAELLAEETTALEPGKPVAWGLTRKGGVTVGFSPVHRVGTALAGRERTTCGLVIPEPTLRLPMSPAIAQAMRKCQECESDAVRLSRENAA